MNLAIDQTAEAILDAVLASDGESLGSPVLAFIEEAAAPPKKQREASPMRMARQVIRGMADAMLDQGMQYGDWQQKGARGVNRHGQPIYRWYNPATKQWREQHVEPGSGRQPA